MVVSNELVGTYLENVCGEYLPYTNVSVKDKDMLYVVIAFDIGGIVAVAVAVAERRDSAPPAVIRVISVRWC